MCLIQGALMSYRKFLVVLNLGITSLVIGCTSGTVQGSSNNAPTCSVDYWVSPQGNDQSESGTQANPFKTIERAQLAVRNNPQRGICGINVNIFGGVYTLTQPLVFTNLDSGSAKAQVVYQQAPNTSESVVISGGINITGFNCSSNTCTAAVPDLPSGIMPRQFYVNGTRAIRARSNYGESINADYIRTSLGYDQFLPQPLTHPELVEAVTVTQWKMMRCPVDSLAGNTLIMKNPCWNNANTYPVPWNFQLLSWLENAPEFLTEPNMWYLSPEKQISYINSSAAAPVNAVLPVIESLVVLSGNAGNPVSNISFKNLTFAYATWFGPNSSNGYVADQSGNFLLGDNYESNTIGHQQVVYSTPGNISLSYANNITFSGNTFTHLGGVALALGTGSQNNQIINNTFTDISSAAIQVGGVSPTDMRPDSASQTSNNLVKNNVISYTGRDYYDTAAIYVGFTTGTKITHNSISHTPWSSIAIGWGWGLFDQSGFPGLPHATPNEWGSYSTPTIASNNEISSNYFSDFLEQLWDGGAIYTNGSQGAGYSNGLLIQLNVAENKRPNAGSNIYYTDGGTEYVTLNQNVSLNDPVGFMDFGPCFIPDTLTPYGSAIYPLCMSDYLKVSYGSDMGGCLPVGHIRYTSNYFLNPTNFFGPELCKNESYIPPYPVDLSMINNVATSSAAQVPDWILKQAGVQ